MARYATTVESPLAPAESFAKVADLANFEKWDPGVSESVQVQGDGPAVGAAYDVTVKSFTGGSMVLTYVITEFTPGERVVALAETSNLRSYDIISVVPSDAAGEGGSALTYDAELELKGIFRPANLLLGFVFNRIGDAADKGLRTYLA